MRFQLLQWWFWSAATRVAHAFAPSIRRWCSSTSFAPSLRRWRSPTTHAFAPTPSPRRSCNLRAARTAAEEQELLLTEPAVNAFIVAEVEAFVRERSYASEDQDAVTSDDVALITEATRAAYRAADSADVMGSLSTGLAFLRPRFEGADLEGPLQRARLSPYQLAHHITDMYHHRCFRGAPTKTLAATGAGEVAAREAVGLPPAAAAEEDDDDCIVWTPDGITPRECLQRRSDADAWRQRRFERVQMEGTRDPRRGSSGTSRSSR